LAEVLGWSAASFTRPGETGQRVGADRDADGHLVARPVVANLELERVVQAALERFRQGCDRERELR
jgi:hypothetical protein